LPVRGNFRIDTSTCRFGEVEELHEPELFDKELLEWLLNNANYCGFPI
jgi:hypothetical protein